MRVALALLSISLLGFSCFNYSRVREHVFSIKGDDKVLFYNVPNEVSVLVEGMNCDDLKFESTDSTTVSKDRCTLTITPNERMDDHFLYLPFQYWTTTDTLFFIVQECPAPEVSILNFWDHRRGFNFQFKQLTVSTNNTCSALGHQILSFDVVYKNEDSVWYQASNIGGQFTEQDKKVFFDKFTFKDTLYIDNIVTIGNDSVLRYPEKGRYFLW